MTWISFIYVSLSHQKELSVGYIFERYHCNTTLMILIVYKIYHQSQAYIVSLWGLSRVCCFFAVVGFYILDFKNLTSWLMIDFQLWIFAYYRETHWLTDLKAFKKKKKKILSIIDLSSLIIIYLSLIDITDQNKLFKPQLFDFFFFKNQNQPRKVNLTYILSISWFFFFFSFFLLFTALIPHQPSLVGDGAWW